MIAPDDVFEDARSDEDSLAFNDMEWAEPRHSRQQVNAAWRTFTSVVRTNPRRWKDSDYDTARQSLIVINNWRRSHGFPLNTIQVNLRGRARRIDDNCVVSQRLKRRFSMFRKLYRFPKMKLTQMQDIGGCRAVVDTVAEVKELYHSYRMSRSNHELVSVDNYITSPKQDGYRGVHLIYKFQSNAPHRRVYNNLKIEIQLRSRYQHAWATAVEIVGTLIGQGLKFDEGGSSWLRFFSLMGATIAVRENSPVVPDTPNTRENLIRELGSEPNLTY